MSDLHTKMVAWHLTADEYVCFIMDVLGDGLESSDETRCGEEGDAESACMT